MNNKLAMCSGVLGQDSAYLVKYLLEKGYNVIGLHRRYSTLNTWRLDELGITNHPNLSLIECDINDCGNLYRIIHRYKSDLYFSLAAVSHVATSFEQPDITFETNANAVINTLEALRLYSPHTRFYQASTSELWGSNYTIKDGKKVQNEETPFQCNSPYSVSKFASHQAVDFYRRCYGLYAVAGILHNHESPLRGDNFVSRKITRWIASYMKSGQSSNHPKLKLGNINSVRDFGYAKEYVECMLLMLEQKEPKDYVIGTGVATTVKQFLSYCFDVVGINDWEKLIEIDKSLFRSCEVDFLCADASKAERELGWKPRTTVKELAEIMTLADLRRVGL